MTEKIDPGEAKKLRKDNVDSLNAYLNFLDTLLDGDLLIDEDITSDLLHLKDLFYYNVNLEELIKEVSILAAIGGINEIMEVIKNHSGDQDRRHFDHLAHVAYRAFRCGLEFNKEASYVKILGRYFIEVDIASGGWALGRALENARWLGETDKIQELSGKAEKKEEVDDATAMKIIRRANQVFLQEIQNDPIMKIDKKPIIEKLKAGIRQKLETI